MQDKQEQAVPASHYYGRFLWQETMEGSIWEQYPTSTMLLNEEIEIVKVTHCNS